MHYGSCGSNLYIHMVVAYKASLHFVEGATAILQSLLNKRVLTVASVNNHW